MTNHPSLLAFLSVTALFIFAFFGIEPCFETNDDVVMSMIVHGYGSATYASPQLVFSNVLWGYLVGSIPSINGVLGYSIATIAVLLAIGWATLYFLLRLEVGYIISLLTVLLILIRPVLFPQFTMNAGLLTVAAILGWQVYARIGGSRNLILASLLAFLGFLIRDTEFLLVLVVALPLLPWKVLLKQREMQIAFLSLSLGIAAAAAFNHWSYSGLEWKQFNEFNTVRVPFTDYGAGEHLKNHPEIIASHGYSLNDITLLSNWFFIDPQIADSQVMSKMLNKLDPIFLQSSNLKLGFLALKTLIDIVLVSILLSAFFLLALRPRWSIVLSWLMFISALFIIGILGRPGVLRVYIPVLSLLLIAPLWLKYNRGRVEYWIVVLTLFSACAANIFIYTPEALTVRKLVVQAHQDIQRIPVESIVSWGNTAIFPFDLVFPVLANDLNARNIKIYSLDSFTQAPYSRSKSGNDLLKRYQNSAGIPIMASPQLVRKLSTYCSEHLDGTQHEIVRYRSYLLNVLQVSCVAAP